MRGARVIGGGLLMMAVATQAVAEDQAGTIAQVSEPITHTVDPVAPLPVVQAYEPIYLLFGGEPTIAKFQVSLKTRLFNPAWNTPRDGIASEGLYFAYSQTTFWDLSSDSRPFYDSSYRPEIFWLQDDVQADWLADRAQLWWQVGARHQSNGQDGIDSRSFNIAYFQPSINVRWTHRRFLNVIPAAWIYIGDRSDNSDIAEYLGYGQLKLVGGKEDGFQLSALMRIGSGFSHPYFQGDLTYPLSRVGSGYFRPFLHLQATAGYGESLLNYTEYEQRILFGLSFVR